jgi:CheY-like chemotaxis protein
MQQTGRGQPAIERQIVPQRTAPFFNQLSSPLAGAIIFLARPLSADNVPGLFESCPTFAGQGAPWRLLTMKHSDPRETASASAPTLQRSVEAIVARRILLVEDNKDIAEGMGTLLAVDGHTVSIAHDGAVALEMLRSFEPEVVLLDIGLPGMDGYEVARRMRAGTARSNLVIVSLSGFGEPQHHRRSSEAGCNAHIVKPIEPDALRTFLAHLETPPKKP